MIIVRERCTWDQRECLAAQYEELKIAKPTLQRLQVKHFRCEPENMGRMAAALEELMVEIPQQLKELVIERVEVPKETFQMPLTRLFSPLKRSGSVVVLKLRWCNLSDGDVTSLSRVLGMSASLRDLDLTGNTGVNARGFGAQALSEYLGGSSLFSLSLAQCGLGAGEVQQLVEAIREKSQLGHLNLADNPAGGAHAALAGLAEHTASLTSLDLSGLGETGEEGARAWRTEGAAAVLRAVGRSATLTSLDLSRSRCGDEGFERAGPFLSDALSLKSLTLSASGLTDRSLHELFKMMRDNRSVRSLVLRGNSFGAAAAQMSALVGISPFLTDVDLADNPDVPERVLAALARHKAQCADRQSARAFFTSSGVLPDLDSLCSGKMCDLVDALLDTRAVDALLDSGKTSVSALRHFGETNFLFCHGNVLSQPPAGLSAFLAVTYLDLSACGLRSVGHEVTAMAAVSVLDLRWNCLSDVPESIFSSMPALDVLLLSYNPDLRELPPCAYQRPLSRLEVHGTALLRASPHALPLIAQSASFASAISLASLPLRHVPLEVSFLERATSLSLAATGLSLLPPSLARLTALTSLNVANNDLTFLPHEIGELTRLETLDVSGNPLSNPALLAMPTKAVLESLRSRAESQETVHRVKVVVCGNPGAAGAFIVSALRLASSAPQRDARRRKLRRNNNNPDGSTNSDQRHTLRLRQNNTELDAAIALGTGSIGSTRPVPHRRDEPVAAPSVSATQPQQQRFISPPPDRHGLGVEGDPGVRVGSVGISRLHLAGRALPTAPSRVRAPTSRTLPSIPTSSPPVSPNVERNAPSPPRSPKLSPPTSPRKSSMKLVTAPLPSSDMNVRCSVWNVLLDWGTESVVRTMVEGAAVVVVAFNALDERSVDNVDAWMHALTEDSDAPSVVLVGTVREEKLFSERHMARQRDELQRRLERFGMLASVHYVSPSSTRAVEALSGDLFRLAHQAAGACQTVPAAFLPLEDRVLARYFDGAAAALISEDEVKSLARELGVDDENAAEAVDYVVCIGLATRARSLGGRLVQDPRWLLRAYGALLHSPSGDVVLSAKDVVEALRVAGFDVDNEVPGIRELFLERQVLFQVPLQSVLPQDAASISRQRRGDGPDYPEMARELAELSDELDGLENKYEVLGNEILQVRLQVCGVEQEQQENEEKESKMVQLKQLQSSRGLRRSGVVRSGRWAVHYSSRRRLVRRSVRVGREGVGEKAAVVVARLAAQKPRDVDVFFEEQSGEVQVVRVVAFAAVTERQVFRAVTRVVGARVVEGLFWRDGALLVEDGAQALVEAVYARHTVHVTVSGDEVGPLLLALVQALQVQGRSQVQVPCGHCLELQPPRGEPYLFPLEQVEAAASSGASVVRCRHVWNADGPVDVQVSDVAPDLALTELRRFELDAREVVMGARVASGSRSVICRAHVGAREVAVKQLVIPADEEFDAEAAQVFQQFRVEAGILCRLRHDNIVGFVGFLREPLALVMELVPGGNLFDRLETMRAWPDRLAVAQQVAHGMAYLHSCRPPVIHRDLKSANVLLGDVAKVADFGVSVRSRVAFGRDVDNPFWLAVEVIRGEEHGVMSDVFSFAVVLWELLTLRRPYADVDDFLWRTEQRIVAGLRPSIREDDEVLCPIPQFIDLIKKCWHQNPMERPDFIYISKQLDNMIVNE